MHRTGLTLSPAQFSRWRTTTCASLIACRDYSQNQWKADKSRHAPFRHASKAPVRSPRKGVTIAESGEAEPPNKDSREPSIFSQLFERHHTGSDGKTQQFDLPRGVVPQRQKAREKAAKQQAPSRTVYKDDAAEAPIFEQLFRGKEAPASKDIAHKRRVTRLARRPDENIRENKDSDVGREYMDDISSENTISISIRNHFRNWATKQGILPETAPKLREYGSHSTVLVLSSVSPSLQESDFHRIAPQGQHLEGWSNGLMKVVQVHDPATYQPLGQYYLFFHSKPSALDYMERVKHLHALSKRAMFSGPGKYGKDDVNAPYPQVRSEDQEALGAFTLVPPSLDLDLTVRLWNSDFVREAWGKSNIRDIFQDPGAGPTTECKVVLALSRGGLSHHDLRLAIEEDGRRRNLAWKLRNTQDSIMPIKFNILTESEQTKAQRAGDVSSPHKEDSSAGQESTGETEKYGTERFPRYLLTFANATESRRFARNWHKRTVHDDVNQWTVEAEATALW